MHGHSTFFRDEKIWNRFGLKFCPIRQKVQSPGNISIPLKTYIRETLFFLLFCPWFYEAVIPRRIAAIIQPWEQKPEDHANMSGRQGENLAPFL